MSEGESGDPPQQVAEPHGPDCQAEHEKDVINTLQNVADAFDDEAPSRQQGLTRNLDALAQ